MSAKKPTSREFAALAYALALTRGQLSSAESGELEKNELAQILEGTSAANIAAALGLKESDLAIDWNQHLSREQMEKIRGARDD